MLSFLQGLMEGMLSSCGEVLQAALDADVYLSPRTDEDARAQVGFGLAGIGV